MGRWVVCSAWPYVHATPHLGTFLHLLSADVFTRYLRAKGEEVVSVSGSDEHGTPIEVEAIREGIEPRALTDKQHAAICELLRCYRIELDNYTRTENPVHIQFVQDFYRRIYENGYVFTKEVELTYCEKDDLFLPDRFVQGICPFCKSDGARGDQCENCDRVLDPIQLIEPSCVLCGARPTIRSAKHWFFDLPKFSDAVREYLDSNPQLPDNARNFSYGWIEEGLRPRALTRDSRWGIPAPFPSAEGKTIYVWMEAVLGYLSATVEWFQRIGKADRADEFWLDEHTKNVHFIGKDNVPFHIIIFPALLLATRRGYVLPWQVSSTEFITFEGQRFSRSHGIGVWIDETLEIAEPDVWRYVLMAIRPESSDVSFTWELFEQKVNADLNDTLGNFIHRTLTFVERFYRSVVPPPRSLGELDEQMVAEIRRIPRIVGDLMDQMRLKAAVEAIIDFSRRGNRYLNAQEPWRVVKASPEKASVVIYVCVQHVRSLAILLAPFMPSAAETVWRQLNLQGDVHQPRWDSAEELAVPAGHRIGHPEPLFHKVDAKEIRSALNAKQR
ncbi:MAG: methionine--tRNA ligase [Nitrososphaeria archaeon]